MIIGSISVLSTLSLALLYKFQNRLVYPSWAQNARNVVQTPDTRNLPYKHLTLHTPDNESLQAFDLPNHEPDSHTTVLILCPNAGNIGYFIPIIELFFRQLHCSVFIYSYRGYGRSTGVPTETGLKIDADTAMQHLINDPFHRDKKKVIYGRSLGGAVGIYLANRFKNVVDGVLLENTFLSVNKVIPFMFPWLSKVAFLCHENWNSELLIDKLDSDVPMLFLNGSLDEIVPPEHMQQLFTMCNSTKKQFVEFRKGHHNDTILQNGYWEAISDFLIKYDLL